MFILRTEDGATTEESWSLAELLGHVAGFRSHHVGAADMAGAMGGGDPLAGQSEFGHDI